MELNRCRCYPSGARLNGASRRMVPREPSAYDGSIGTIKPRLRILSLRSSHQMTGGAGMARRLVTAIAVLVGSALNGAHAQNDLWCAYFTGGSPSCAFATFDECIKAIRGKTGICDRKAEPAAPMEPNASSPSAAIPSPAATATTTSKDREARPQHFHRHRAHLPRGRKLKGRGARRHRLNLRPNGKS